jgi:hypothetical protein
MHLGGQWPHRFIKPGTTQDGEEPFAHGSIGRVKPRVVGAGTARSVLAGGDLRRDLQVQATRAKTEYQ